MSEPRQRSTRSLSRETVQLMLQMQSLLREYGVTISLSAPNVYDLLIQAAEAIDDKEIDLLRRRLIAATPPELSADPIALDEEGPFIDDVEATPAVGKLFEALKPALDPIRHVYLQGPFVEEEADVFLESEKEQTPTTKRLTLSTPRTGLLRCDQCQRTHTVMVAASREEVIEMQCACGRVYRVMLDSRQSNRKFTELLGLYVDQNDATKTGTIVVENISFSGLKFRTTSQQQVAHNDLLHVQFTLDDEAQTLIWEKVRVHSAQYNIVGAEFMNRNELSKDLASYLMR